MRSTKIVAVVALAAGALWASAGSAGAVAPSMVVSSPTVAVGGTVDVTVDQCDPVLPDGTGDPDNFPHVFLVTGSGAAAVRAAIGERLTATTFRITVPGWVDPADPAVIAGGCDQHYFGHSYGLHWQRQFSYPDVAIDVTPAGGPVPYPSFTLSRTTAQAGQAVQVDGQGCGAGQPVSVLLEPGTDLAWRDGPPTGFRYDDGRWSGSAPTAGADGTFTASFVLNTTGSPYEPGVPGDAGPLPEGPYVVRVGCGPDSDYHGITPSPEAPPATLQITGTNPSGSSRVGPSAEVVHQTVMTGDGCDGGREVMVSYADDAYDPSSGGGFGPVQPAADGSWSTPVEMPEDLNRYFTADCGDPLGTGFRYVLARSFAPASSDLEVTTVTPSTVAAGADFVAVVVGRCPADIDAVVYDAKGTVVATSSAIAGNGAENTYRFNLTAPATPDGYHVAGRCDVAAGPGVALTVVAIGDAVPATPIPGSAGYTG